MESRDEASFRELYRLDTPALYGMAMRLSGGHSHEAQDLVQETWLRAVKAIERFGGGSSWRTWLMAILINCYREQLRKLKRECDDETESQTASPGNRVDAHIDLERLVAQLNPHHRAVILLFEVQGMSHEQIAHALDIPEGTSRSRLARARQQLQLLAGCQEEGEV